MKKIITLILISSSLIFSCNNSSINQNQINPVAMLVSEKEPDASEIEVNSGEEFMIVLDGNAAIGYQWSEEKYDEKFITFVNSKYEPLNNATGVGGKFVLTFKANIQGQTDIIMKYFKPLDKSIKPIKKQKFSINIKEPNTRSVLQLKFFTDIRKKMGL